MTTKTIEYYVDLSPCWDALAVDPYVMASPPSYPKDPNHKRVKIMIELPIFGYDSDMVVMSDSREINTGNGVKHED